LPQVRLHPLKDPVWSTRSIRVVISALVVDAGFFEPAADHAIIEHRRIAPGALANAEVVLLDQHPHPASEIARAVGKKLDRLQAQVLAPLVITNASLTQRQYTSSAPAARRSP
jgi:hypothetical protein